MTRSEIKKEVIDWVKTILFALAFAIVMRMFVFEFVIVEQSSMYPTLKPADRLCVFKITYRVSKPHRGDVAVLKISENKTYVKRVIGLPGETIKIEENTVYIDGDPLYEPYLVEGLKFDDFPETKIPEKSYFVMGDNRPSSIDSRRSTIGFIKEGSFIGQVGFRLSPFTWFL